jgi:hypothetical protein
MAPLAAEPHVVNTRSRPLALHLQLGGMPATHVRLIRLRSRHSPVGSTDDSPTENIN